MVSGDSVGTRVHVDARIPASACSSEALALGWTEALHKLQAKRSRRPDDIALGVIAYGPQGPRTLVRFVDMRARVPLVISLGRHSRCDVRGITDASLRHAVVLAWPRPSAGAPPMEVLDLRTGAGLVLRSGSRVRRLASPGPLRFALGGEDIALLYAPAGGRFPVDFPDELDGWGALEDRVAHGMTRPVLDAGFDENTNLSIVSRMAGGYRRLLDGARVDLRGFEIVSTTERGLARGVLLGRYERCDRAARFLDSPKVSRVHALAITRRGRLFVVDVGSLNGTQVVTPSGDVVSNLTDDRRAHRLRTLEGLCIGGKRVAFALSDIH